MSKRTFRSSGVVFPFWGLVMIMAAGVFSFLATSGRAVDYQIDIGASQEGNPLSLTDTIRATMDAAFDIYFGNSDDTVAGYAAGFTIWSVDGADWTWEEYFLEIQYNPQTMEFDTSWSVVTFLQTCRQYPPYYIWDNTGLNVQLADTNGAPRDSILFGGLRNNRGMIPGPLERQALMHFRLDEIGDQESKTICIDSVKVGLGGDFVFTDIGGQAYAPTALWPSGGRCWPVAMPRPGCPYDSDNDGYGDPGHPENDCPDDNCPYVFNTFQEDADGDGIGDACDECTDLDGDNYGDPGFPANTCAEDNCPDIYNPNQQDADGDGIGDLCDACTDTDNDGYGNPGYALNTCPEDNCPNIYNPNQSDADEDGVGDECDICTDSDGDGYRDSIIYTASTCPLDNCSPVYNPDQEDADGDGIGDECDKCTDIDGDGYGNPEFFRNTCPDDNCPYVYNPGQNDADGDFVGDVCDVGDPLFTASPRCGGIPLTVQFTDTSIALSTITKWTWNFGDGDSSNDQNPQHEYNEVDAFTVKLIISNGENEDTLIKPAYITTQEALTVDFSATDTDRHGSSPRTVMFTSNVTGAANEYYWDFGDGEFSSDDDAIHVYQTQGKFTVKLAARMNLDGCNQVDSIIKQDYVLIDDMDAKFHAEPTAGDEPLTVQFLDDSDGSPDTWYWDFGDGYTSGQQNPEHIYENPGDYTVFMRATNFNSTDSLRKPTYIHVHDLYCDLANELYVVAVPRPGFSFWFYDIYTNLGTQSADNSVLKVLPPEDMILDAEHPVYLYNPVTQTQNPTTEYTTSGDTLIFDLGTVDPSNWFGGYYLIYGQLSEFVPIGDTIYIESWLSSSCPDVEHGPDNYLIEAIEVVGSIDPNDKRCGPVPKGDDNVVDPGQRLTYTIMFENKPEATYPATYVRVIDTLSPLLDWGTLAFVNMSHPNVCECDFDPFTGVIECFCDNMMLPPNHNPPEGEGYFVYSISPLPDLPEGSEVANIAWIRFDYNAWLQAPEEGPVVRVFAEPFKCGDANGDGGVNIGDVVFLVVYIFHYGPEPEPYGAGEVNCDGSINVGDIVYLMNYIFRISPPPCYFCK